MTKNYFLASLDNKIQWLDTASMRLALGIDAVVVVPPPVVLPPPVITPLPTPVPTTGGDITPASYAPLHYSMWLWDVPEQHVAAIGALGVFRGVVYQTTKWNGGHEYDAVGWLAAIKTAGMKIMVLPEDYNLLDLADNPSVELFIGIDEMGTMDGPGGTMRETPDGFALRIKNANIKLAAAGKRIVPWILNTGAYPTLFNVPINREYGDVIGLAAYSSDIYYPDQNLPRQFGRADWGSTFTSTIEGACMDISTNGPMTTYDKVVGGWQEVPGTRIVANLGIYHKPAFSMILACSDNYDKPELRYSPAVAETIASSNIIFGGVGLILFDSVFGTNYFEDTGMLIHAELLPWLQDWNRRMALLETTGCFFSARGGRTPYVTYKGAPATTCAGAQQGPRDGDVTVWAAPKSDQFPGGFEAVEMFNDAGTASVRYISNRQLTPMTLDHAWKPGLVFAPGQAMAFSSVDGFTRNIIPSRLLAALPA